MLHIFPNLYSLKSLKLLKIVVDSPFLNNLRSSIFLDCSYIFLSNNSNVLEIFSCSLIDSRHTNIVPKSFALIAG